MHLRCDLPGKGVCTADIIPFFSVSVSMPTALSFLLCIAEWEMGKILVEMGKWIGWMGIENPVEVLFNGV